MTAAILNHPITGTAPFASAQAAPMAASNAATGTSANSGASSAGISANDFLTLLVTEMKNQDPTATTDPNEYINQLVNVNSLEQLIDINQTLTSAYEPTGTASTGAAQTAASPQNATTQPLAQAGASSASIPASLAHTLGPSFAQGNLSIPTSNPSAVRLSQALDGNTRQSSFTEFPTVR